MEERIKKRLVGAAVLVTAFVVFAPMVFEQGARGPERVPEADIPPPPAVDFRSRILPVDGPGTGPAPPPAAEPAPALDGIEGAGATSPPVAASPADGAVPPANAPTAPASSPPPAPAPQPPLSAWAVQLGAFSQASNAVGLRDELRGRGFPVFVESVRINGDPMTRVYVGPELLRSAAEAARERLAAEVDLKGIVVRYPPE